jgi:hypothetical protein
MSVSISGAGSGIAVIVFTSIPPAVKNGVPCAPMLTSMIVV